MASMALDMVLAVYMPPHDPAPGHASHSIALTPFSSSLPAWNCPTALDGVARKPIEMGVARRDIAEQRSDTDHGPGEVVVMEADGAQHGAVRGAAWSGGGETAGMSTLGRHGCNLLGE